MLSVLARDCNVIMLFYREKVNVFMNEEMPGNARLGCGFLDTDSSHVVDATKSEVCCFHFRINK